MGGIFGGPAKSKTSNQAYGTLKDAFSGALPFTQQGGNAMMALLGGDSSGFDKFKQATGFDFLSKQGSQGITGNAAARGLLRSGGTGKALMDYGAGMQNKYANDYLSQLLGVGNLGLGAGGLLAQAGQKTKSGGGGKSGLGNALGTGASLVAMSDRRLKTNIKKVGKLANGLNVYTFEYTYKPGFQRGVMADEVALIQPEALGPVLNGYQTVDYAKIGVV